MFACKIRPFFDFVVILYPEMGRILYHIGRYGIFLQGLFLKPEKVSVYARQTLKEITIIGWSSLGIVTLISLFLGAVICIQSAYNLANPFVPITAVAVVTRDSIILEFSCTIVCLVLAGKIGSNIASQLGTMRVTEQIDALEIMGINSSGYLVLPKIVAGIIIIPFVVLISMFLGIVGGWIGGATAGVITTGEYMLGIMEDFKVFNVTFALMKTVSFAFAITSVSSYHGYFTEGGALEVGRSSTKAVVYSCTLILFLDYIITQIVLS